MKRQLNQLSVKQVAGEQRPGYWPDGGNLYLLVAVNADGSIRKSWIFRYTYSRNKKRELGLGSVRDVSLKDAREKAADLRKQIADGIDPKEAKKGTQQQAQIAKAYAVPFSWYRDAFVAEHVKLFKNTKHRQQWVNTLNTYAGPFLDHLPPSEITMGLIEELLRQRVTNKKTKRTGEFWTVTHETATRVRERIETILDYSAAVLAKNKLPAPWPVNPALWGGKLDNLLATISKKKTVKHFVALPYLDLPAFLQTVRANQAVAAPALEFTILTCARTHMVREAPFSEFDLDNAIWTIPRYRMKVEDQNDNEEFFRIPLGKRALEIIRAQPKGSPDELVFRGDARNGGLSDAAMRNLAQSLTPDMEPRITVHGFRSAYLDWSTETRNHEPKLRRKVLAHTVGDETERSYQRGDLLNKRRKVMEDWEQYCEKKIAKVLKFK